MFQFSLHAGKTAEPVHTENIRYTDGLMTENQESAEGIKSVELLYAIAQNEYSNEHERTNMIHSKAGIALPIISAYFLALIQMNDYKSMLAIMVTDFWSSMTAASLFLSYTISAALSLAAVVYMAKVAFTKGYMRMDPENLYTKDNLTLAHQDFVEKLIKIYFNAINFNINVNNERMKQYKKSWIYTFYSVLCFVVYIVIKNNI